MLREFWEQKPLRTAVWEMKDDGRIVILIPKFKNKWLQRWILPLLAKQYFRVQLDEVGSLFWKLSDGTRTLEHIKRDMQDEFGEHIEPVEIRLGRFVHQLYSGGLLKFL